MQRVYGWNTVVRTQHWGESKFCENKKTQKLSSLKPYMSYLNYFLKGDVVVWLQCSLQLLIQDKCGQWNIFYDCRVWGSGIKRSGCIPTRTDSNIQGRRRERKVSNVHTSAGKTQTRPWFSPCSVTHMQDNMCAQLVQTTRSRGHTGKHIAFISNFSLIINLSVTKQM